MLLKKIIIPGILIIFLKMHIINAQDDVPFNHINLSYKDYISLVKSDNLEYAAEKLNINISEAAIEVAKIFNDPYISVDWIGDYENNTQNGYEISSELVKTIDLAGKRNARINLSMSENELTKAMVADYFRNLQAEATLIYLDALKQQKLFRVGEDSYQTLKQLYQADSVRLMLGSIMKIDASQSKLEAGILYNESINALVQWKNSLAQISLMTGELKKDTLFLPVNHMHNSVKEFSLYSLINIAKINRTDIIVASLNKEVSEKNLTLAKKERRTEMDLKLGLADSYLTGGFSNVSSAITAGIAIPLKFSNFYKGDIKIAEGRILQAEELYKQAELLIEAEITQAWELYLGYSRQVENFDNGLLENAESVRKGKTYSYQRGETSLLEVLNAQRTYNEIQTTYYEVQFNRAAALVELERAAGIWDIDF
jgi:outer membrane protein, heavy metal efflux system